MVCYDPIVVKIHQLDGGFGNGAFPYHATDGGALGVRLPTKQYSFGH